MVFDVQSTSDETLFILVCVYTMRKLKLIVYALNLMLKKEMEGMHNASGCTFPLTVYKLNAFVVCGKRNGYRGE